MNEQRHFQRIPFSSKSLIRCPHQEHAGALLDISLRGALFQIDAAPGIPTGTTCDLTIEFYGCDIRLEFAAELIHHESDRYGFRLGATDLDSFTHLRRLLELNSGDPDEIHRELFDWLQPT
jgi:hypothetical protein